MKKNVLLFFTDFPLGFEMKWKNFSISTGTVLKVVGSFLSELDLSANVTLFSFNSGRINNSMITGSLLFYDSV